MLRTAIIGTGAYLPERVVTNEELSGIMGLSTSDIFDRSGIRERRKASEKEATSDLATHAAEHALQDAGVSPREIDLILVATTSPDMAFPSTACLVQRNLGAKRVIAFDMNASCSGFLFGLHIADAFIQAGTVQKALVVAAEIKSRFVDTRDSETGYLFGDGAGAVVLKGKQKKNPPLKDSGVLWSKMGTDGSRHSWIQLPAGGSRRPTTSETLNEGANSMKLEGGRVFRAACRGMEKTLREALSDTEISIEKISLFLFHQANLRILQKVAKDLSIPPEKVPLTIERYGNASSASLPITLDEIARSGRIKQGDLLYLGTFGGGLTWGGMIIRW